MVPLRLLTFLFILSNALVTGTETENQDQVRCEDEPKTSTVPPTARDLCKKYEMGFVALFKRKNGWWCETLLYETIPNFSLTYKEASETCSSYGFPSVGSLETEKEIKAYSSILPIYKVDSFWVNVSLNKTNGQYYWSDGFATPTINPQPTVFDPNGKGVWMINRDPSVPGYGNLSIFSPTDKPSVNTRGVLCGGPASV